METITGFISGKALKKEIDKKGTTIIALSCILGTAAVINEIFAVILAKQGFKYAGELESTVEYTKASIY